MVDYTPATDIQIINYQLIKNDAVFDKSCLVNANLAKQFTNDLIKISEIVYGTTNVPTELTNILVQLNALINHLSNHFDNLLDNINLVSSGISDAIGYKIIGSTGEITGSLNDPLASVSSFFGSVLGTSDAMIAQITTTLMGIFAQLNGLISGTMVATLIKGGNSQILSALAPINNLQDLTTLMSNIQYATNLSILSTSLANAEAVINANSNLQSLPEVIEIETALGYIKIATTDSSNNSVGG